MEDFVPFETAKKLKEKGFREKCYRHYYPDSKDWFLSSSPECDNYSGYLDIPTISQVLKWLREEKRIYVGAEWVNKKGKWIGYVDEMNMPDLVGEYIFPNTYDSYELAALAGVNYCLDNLI